jgi:hypothetical protein
MFETPEKKGKRVWWWIDRFSAYSLRRSLAPGFAGGFFVWSVVGRGSLAGASGY